LERVEGLPIQVCSGPFRRFRAHGKLAGSDDMEVFLLSEPTLLSLGEPGGGERRRSDVEGSDTADQ
jgi:hypothetical protein